MSRTFDLPSVNLTKGDRGTLTSAADLRAEVNWSLSAPSSRLR
ncbi:MAG: hypothetical protein ACTS4T_00395 [Candidatus Hodgkinia cicadicola]